VPTSRVTDADAQRAVDALTPRLAKGQVVRGVRAALAVLVAAAGPAPAGTRPSPELQDVLTGEGTADVR
jgi:hypothetical protein